MSAESIKVEKLDFFIQEFKEIDTEEKLDLCAEKLVNYIQTLCGIKRNNRKSKPNDEQNCRVDLNNSAQVQNLYDYQEHRVVQEILQGQSFHCEIDPKTIENHFTKKLSKKNECKISDLSSVPWPETSPSLEKETILNKNFSQFEVNSKLNAKIYSKLSNSRSVGVDRIKYKNFKKHDPESAVITELINACLKLQYVPKIWKELYSVPIKTKGGDNLEVKDWILVTLHNTIFKLFQNLIASRLIYWAKETNRFSPTQKGYLLNNAACEVSYILQESKKYALQNKKELLIAWLDFSDAFDLIPLEAIIFALEKHSVPMSYRNLIQNLLKDLKTYVRCKHGNTKNIPIIGFPQGSPLGPVLIDLLIEPILKELESDKDNGFQIFGKKINHFVIPNELAVIAESKGMLQNLLNSIEKTAKILGLRFNIRKCVTYHSDKNNQIQGNKFLFFGQHLNAIKEHSETDKCFGVRQGLSIGQSGIPTVEEMIESVEKISASKLQDYQKLGAVQTFIVPRVENCLRGIDNLDESRRKNLENAEKILTDRIKNWLHMREDASYASIVFQVSKSVKRTTEKFYPFVDLFDLMKIVQAFKMLTSQDIFVREVAISSLKEKVLKEIKHLKGELTKKHLADYLSGSLKIKDKNLEKCLDGWSIVREATLQLNKKMNLTWCYKNETMELKIRDLNKKRRQTITDNIRFNVETKLKNRLLSYYINEVNKTTTETKKNSELSKGNSKKLESPKEVSKNLSKTKKSKKPRKKTPVKINKNPKVSVTNKPSTLPFAHTSDFPVLLPSLTSLKIS